MLSQTPCGCTWKRTAKYGDVVVTQCLAHARQSRSGRSRAASAAANASIRRLRALGKIKSTGQQKG